MTALSAARVSSSHAATQGAEPAASFTVSFPVPAFASPNSSRLKPLPQALPAVANRPYFSLRQLIDPRFSTLLDSTSMSKPRSSRFLHVSTWQVPSRETPKPTDQRGAHESPHPTSEQAP